MIDDHTKFKDIRHYDPKTGKRHRMYGPAWIKHDRHGGVPLMYWFHQNYYVGHSWKEDDNQMPKKMIKFIHEHILDIFPESNIKTKVEAFTKHLMKVKDNGYLNDQLLEEYINLYKEKLNKEHEEDIELLKQLDF